MRHDIVSGVAVGCISFILVGEVLPERRQSYWLALYHYHTEIPAGNIDFNRRTFVDSGAATSTASTGVLNILPALALGK
jgi:hypothetical protein